MRRPLVYNERQSTRIQDELVNLLNKLPNMTEEEYERLSTNGRRLFEDNFTFDQFKKNYCDLIEDIIQKES